MTAIGSAVAGIFRRDQVGANDWASVLCRSDVTPSRLAYYGGSGPLPKSGTGPVAIDQKVVSQWGDSSSVARTAVLDFSGAAVQVLDTTYRDQKSVTVQILSTSGDGTIARQVDSLSMPLGVDLVRGTQTLSSYASSNWKRLTTESLPAFEAGDILRFRFDAKEKPLSSYTVVSMRAQEEGVTKPSGTHTSTDRLTLRSQDLVSYPNPFNPSTQKSPVLYFWPGSLHFRICAPEAPAFNRDARLVGAAFAVAANS